MLLNDKIKNYIFFLFIFLFIYILNCLTPTFFGDDIVYSYKWEDDMYLLKPLMDNNFLISSFSDLFTSIKTHYLNWHGRLVPVFLMFFWAWVGKNWFDIFNALMFVLLIYFMGKAVYCSTLKNCNWKIYLFFFFAIWCFTPAWVSVFLWQSGSVNYLWTVVLVLYFFIPYLQIDTINQNIIKMFFIGVLVGCTNENNVPVVILGCLYLIYKSIKRPVWSISGVIGLFSGFIVLMCSPSIKNRIISEASVKLPFLNNLEYAESLERVINNINNGQITPWLFEKTIFLDNLITIFVYFITISPFILFLIIYKKYFNNKNIIVFSCMFLLSAICMMFSLYIPFRSLFFSFIYLLVVIVILFYQINIEKWFNLLLKCCAVIFILYFTITGSLYIYAKYISWKDYKQFDNYLKNHKEQSVVYELPRYPSWMKYLKPFVFYNDIDFYWVKNSLCVKYNLKSLEWR